MSSNGDSKSSWTNVVKLGKWGATIAVLGFSVGGGIAMFNAFIAFGEMKSDVRHQGERLASFDERLASFDEKLASFDEKLASFNEKLTNFGISQGRMEGNMEMIVRFLTKDERSDDSAKLDEEGSAENVPAGMSM